MPRIMALTTGRNGKCFVNDHGSGPGEEDPERAARSRRALYWWRLLRQLPWLVLRYRL